MPGFEAMKTQQEAFMKAMTSGFGTPWTAAEDEDRGDHDPGSDDDTAHTELEEIRAQLAAMQAQLAKMGKK